MSRRRDRISARQLGALALSSAGLPVLRVCCRVSWPWVLAGSLAAAGSLCLLTELWERRAGGGRRLFGRLLSPLLLAGALGAAWESGYAFPETAGSWLAAALVLALAGAAAWIGPAAPGRCAGILLWSVGGLCGAVLLFSLPQVRAERLYPAGGPSDALRVWGALLLPGAALWLKPALGPDQRLPRWPWCWSAGAALAASLVTGGILSPPLARDPEAFRTLARGVSVLGVIRRFEALVNGAMLMSGFSLCVLLLSAAALPWKPRAINGPKGPKPGSKKNFEKSEKKC